MSHLGSRALLSSLITWDDGDFGLEMFRSEAAKLAAWSWELPPRMVASKLVGRISIPRWEFRPPALLYPVAVKYLLRSR